MRNLFVALLALMLVGTSCSEFQKVMKSDDYELKYKKAKEYYKAGEYSHALELLEDIRPIYRGTQHAPRIDYLIAEAYFEQEQYILAGYHYSNLAETFPNSSYRQGAVYKSAYCNYLESPRYSLDQSSTKKAIETFKMYVRKYPNSDKVDKCNQYIDELREKLAKKSYMSAKFYLELGDYKAATVALENAMQDFPASSYREDLLFYMLKANFLLAENSVKSKQKERYEKTVKTYYSFIDEYPESPYVEDSKRMFRVSQQALEEQKEEKSLANGLIE